MRITLQGVVQIFALYSFDMPSSLDFWNYQATLHQWSCAFYTSLWISISEDFQIGWSNVFHHPTSIVLRSLRNVFWFVLRCAVLAVSCAFYGGSPSCRLILFWLFSGVLEIVPCFTKIGRKLGLPYFCSSWVISLGGLPRSRVIIILLLLFWRWIVQIFAPLFGWAPLRRTGLETLKASEMIHRNIQYPKCYPVLTILT